MSPGPASGTGPAPRTTTGSFPNPTPAEPALGLRAFWYVAAPSRDLRVGQVRAVPVLDERLALFRDEDGRPVALADRCLHRSAPLSAGRVEGGRLRCGYHGWLYDGRGRVVEAPALGPGAPCPAWREASAWPTLEQDGYVYVRLRPDGPEELRPFPIPHLGEFGWGHVRLVNQFPADLPSCVENFVDVPHTAFVHPGIFRSPRGERLQADVSRSAGTVTVVYRGERANLGPFSRFLNWAGGEIGHVDRFLMPNVTSVAYDFGGGRHLVITSQAVPVAPAETRVHTDLTYRLGAVTRLAGPVVRRLAQRVIDQDIRVLAGQRKVLERDDTVFTATPADVVPRLIESILGELQAARDPRALPARTTRIELWV